MGLQLVCSMYVFAIESVISFFSQLILLQSNTNQKIVKNTWNIKVKGPEH